MARLSPLGLTRSAPRDTTRCPAAQLVVDADGSKHQPVAWLFTDTRATNEEEVDGYPVI